MGVTNNIVEVSIEEIIQGSYMTYARQVILERTIPDIRDGLKPVQRRILYAMQELRMFPEEAYKKSARIVGDVLGKYHPHGDASVYDAMVRLAQNFSIRYTLVDGHGNFGSIDGDPAAAMRYTEVRLAPISMEFLTDLGEHTVEFQLNYDESLKEPKVLPVRIPHLLANGTSGIAVGMSSSIPPHNLSELVDGIIALIKDKNIETNELLTHIKGPDFPTGGIIEDKDLLQVYETGQGKISIRGRILIENLPEGRRQIIIKEIPYQINKGNLIEKIGAIIDKGEIKDIISIADESDQEGIRIVLELENGAALEEIIEILYKKTQLQSTFSVQLLALVPENKGSRARILSLKEALEHYVDFQKSIIRKKTNHELQKAEKEKHIIEGLIYAVDIVDEILVVIRKSKNPKDAKMNIMNKFSFTEIQASSILELKLQRLTNLEIKKLVKKQNELGRLEKKLRSILSSEKNILKELEYDLLRIKGQYGDKRKTEINSFSNAVSREEIKRFTIQAIENKIKKRNIYYKGNKGIVVKSDSTKHIVIFTENGSLYRYTGSNFPEEMNEKIIGILSIDDFSKNNIILFVMNDGRIKKTYLNEYSFKSTSETVKLSGTGKILNVWEINKDADLLIITKKGFYTVVKEKEIPIRKRLSLGGRGIKLDKEDEIISTFLIDPSLENKEKHINIRTCEDKEILISLNSIYHPKKNTTLKSIFAKTTGKINYVKNVEFVDLK